MQQWPDLRGILVGIPWALAGGVATRAYMPERLTQDLDILVRAQDEQEALSRLERAGYLRVERLAIPGHQLRSPQGVEVDLLIGEAGWVDEALGQPAIDGAGYPVLPLAYLVLMKLMSMRAQDWADVSRMLGFASETELDAVRQVVSLHSPVDREDLEALIYLGKREIGPSDAEPSL